MFKKTFLSILIAGALVMTGCGSDDSDDSAATMLKLSLTDAPPEADFEKVEITFTTVEITKASESDGVNAEWITLNENLGSVDLLTLNNGALQEIGVKELEAATYNQIRFTVSEATVTIGGNAETVHLASNTIKLTTPFTLQEGVTTELVVDFDAAHSLHYTSSQWTMTPVTRLAQVDLTGAVRGKITPVTDVTITVIACVDGQTDSFAGTTADAEGNFLIGYLEPGVYDLYVEADGYQTDTSLADITITAGGAEDETANVITLVP
jgi:hypothetical protein